MNKSDYYQQKYNDYLARKRESDRRREYIDLHNKHRLQQASKQYIADLENKNKLKNKRRLGLFFRLFFISLVLIFFVLVFYKARSSQSNLNFTGFLQFLSNLNSVDMDLSMPNYTITESWGVFDFLRNFFNVFNVVFGVIVWLFKNLLNLFNYLIAILNFLFS